MVFINSDDILEAEHDLLVDALDGEVAPNFLSGYITGVISLAEKLKSKKDEEKR